LQDIPFLHSISFYQDEELGWKGKQIFGDLKTNKLKMFIVGDSFTDGGGVNENFMYYHYLQNGKTEFFIYGGYGYGTTQEFLVIDRYFDQINPDLIILQVCSNDFINNQWELERGSYFNNNQMVRPYWIDGHIQYKFPRSFGGTRVFLSTYSRLGYRFFENFELITYSLAARGLLQTVENEIGAKSLNVPAFQKSIQVTALLIKKMQDRIGKTPLIAFPVDTYEPYFSQFKRLFQENNIAFAAQIPEIISQQEVGCLKMPCSGHL
jgi:lysophospholipase L1-like esterase